MNINTKTVKFIGLLNELAQRSKYGIYPFSSVTSEDQMGLWYDDSKMISKADTDNEIFFGSYPLIEDIWIDKDHHEIIETYNEIYAEDGISIVVWVKEDKRYIWVVSDDNELFIIVDNGHWFNL